MTFHLLENPIPDFTNSAPLIDTVAKDTSGAWSERVTLAAFDMDRTLIYSGGALTFGGLDPDLLPPLHVVEHADGEPASRMTKKAWRMLAELMTHAEVVPVTTRTQKQYERIILPRVPHYALCGNGGVLLVDGRRSTTWDSWAHAAAALSAPLAEVQALMTAVEDQEWVIKTKSAEHLFCYLVASHRRDIPGKWLRRFTKQVTEMGWTVSVQGRKVYAVPEGISKASGLMRLRDLLEAQDTSVRVFATGDSLLDASMMVAADAAIRPAHGELHDTAWDHPDVDVTEASGVSAGEEIVGWMLEQAKQPH